jgi:hypothetical protein
MIPTLVLMMLVLLCGCAGIPVNTLAPTADICGKNRHPFSIMYNEEGMPAWGCAWDDPNNQTDTITDGHIFDGDIGGTSYGPHISQFTCTDGECQDEGKRAASYRIEEPR